jgi:hypothetical protein
MGVKQRESLCSKGFGAKNKPLAEMKSRRKMGKKTDFLSAE